VQLRGLITANGLTGAPVTSQPIPDIASPLAQLGKKLFFSKSLGGEFDSACVSCHHPALAGTDNLSMPIGVDADNPDQLGPGRRNSLGVPVVPRNAPSTFNVIFFDSGMFWDSRVESLGAVAGSNGVGLNISTPDSGALVGDPSAGPNIVAAQARFPVTSPEEMRAGLEPGADNATLRAHLAARLGNYGVGAGELLGASWLAEFQTAFASAQPAEQLITFDNIALAIGEYQRSQVFVDNPWRAYVLGDNAAISDQAKRGAIEFFSGNGAGNSCNQCHSGDLFTDERHHAIGIPQFGPGKGNTNDNDFGRENITGNTIERFRFRTASLLNVELTAPYGHTGAYETLREIVDHYDGPGGAVNGFFNGGGWCQLQQFAGVANCQSLYPNAQADSNLAVNKTNQDRNNNDPDALPNFNLSNTEETELVAFLRTLTDPCLRDRTCIAPWIPTPDEDPDGNQVNAVDANGNPL
jgi:cytochrome c peroxidase